jgi:hypothetical protein
MASAEHLGLRPFGESGPRMTLKLGLSGRVHCQAPIAPIRESLSSSLGLRVAGLGTHGPWARGGLAAGSRYSGDEVRIVQFSAGGEARTRAHGLSERGSQSKGLIR